MNKDEKRKYYRQCIGSFLSGAAIAFCFAAALVAFVFPDSVSTVLPVSFLGFFVVIEC